MRFLMAFVLALKCVSMAHSMSYADEDEDEDQALRRLSAEQNQCRGCDTTREEVQVDRNNIKVRERFSIDQHFSFLLSIFPVLL